MFPNHNKIHTGDEIFGMNGYDEIPPYRKLEVTSTDSKVIAESIRSLGDNSCGYIDNGVVNYHFCDVNTFYINMDDKYVYSYFKDVNFTDILPKLMILDFLKFNACKMLIIFEDTSFLLEKTAETYKICKILDKIYASKSFFFGVIRPAVQDKNPEKVFPRLVEVYSMKYMNTDVSNYSTLDLLMKVLKLNVL
ncbi:MAG: hypothetical protein NTY74_14620 [Ignavibacteriae bacterium]|nr:hypothetical protein [Ignavibacteriota bacterium]